ncbi:MAG TPA: hypothetical protein VKC60_10930, partial [Opitutaceae bacterium]|nr:hypothetical protein [Opitutaceae bacterium]
MRSLYLFAALTASASTVFAQSAPSDEEVIKQIFDEALSHGTAFSNLSDLVAHYPGRLSGSKNLEGAIVWGQGALKTAGADKVFTQETMVPHWERGPAESVKIVGGDALTCLALGGSVPTPPEGISAQVVEVKSLAEVEQLGREKLAGKIVFFNRPFDPTLVSTFNAYAGAVDQRAGGPSASAKVGAVAVVVRSMTLSHDDVPHTGALSYAPDVTKIPAAAISWLAADRLSAAL